MVFSAPGWVMQEDKAGAERENIWYLQQHVGWWRESPRAKRGRWKTQEDDSP